MTDEATNTEGDYTKGPWVISPASTKSATWDEIYSADMQTHICSMEMSKQRTIRMTEEGENVLEDTDEIDEAIANAKLIASAPQLKAENERLNKLYADMCGNHLSANVENDRLKADNEALHQQLKDSLLLYNNQTRTVEELQVSNRYLTEALTDCEPTLKRLYDIAPQGFSKPAVLNLLTKVQTALLKLSKL